MVVLRTNSSTTFTSMSKCESFTLFEDAQFNLENNIIDENRTISKSQKNISELELKAGWVVKLAVLPPKCFFLSSFM